MSSSTLAPTAAAIAWFHALSDPTRLEIVALLSHGERCVCELTDVLDAAQSRLSFHLKVLRDAGVVLDRREGRWIHYSLNPAALDGIVQYVESVRPGQHAGSCARACCE